MATNATQPSEADLGRPEAIPDHDEDNADRQLSDRRTRHNAAIGVIARGIETDDLIALWKGFEADRGETHGQNPAPAG